VTDYKLAQALKLPRQRISDYRAGSRQADSYAAAQIALALERDPLEVIAEIEAESARSKPAREFWKSFLSGHLLTIIGGGLLAMSSSFDAGQTARITATDSHNVYYVK
jgi:transcriptional regulator with XRE-family HTH domain